MFTDEQWPNDMVDWLMCVHWMTALLVTALLHFVLYYHWYHIGWHIEWGELSNKQWRKERDDSQPWRETLTVEEPVDYKRTDIAEATEVKTWTCITDAIGATKSVHQHNIQYSPRLTEEYFCCGAVNTPNGSGDCDRIDIFLWIPRSTNSKLSSPASGSSSESCRSICIWNTLSIVLFEQIKLWPQVHWESVEEHTGRITHSCECGKQEGEELGDVGWWEYERHSVIRVSRD